MICTNDPDEGSGVLGSGVYRMQSHADVESCGKSRARFLERALGASRTRGFKVGVFTLILTVLKRD